MAYLLHRSTHVVPREVAELCVHSRYIYPAIRKSAFVEMPVIYIRQELSICPNVDISLGSPIDVRGECATGFLSPWRAKSDTDSARTATTQ